MTTEDKQQPPEERSKTKWSPYLATLHLLVGIKTLVSFIKRQPAPMTMIRRRQWFLPFGSEVRKAGKVNGQKFERNSIIAYTIGCVVLLSALLMTIVNIADADQLGDDGGLCEGYPRSV